VSLADFTVLAAEGVMEWARERHIKEVDSRAPRLNFERNFKFGRKTVTECPKGTGRGQIPALPGGDQGCSEVQRVFLKGMGLSWKESAALMSVHSLGRAQAKFSGFDGWWSSIENQRRFNNDYYWSIIAHGWVPGKGEGGKDQWMLADRAKNKQGNFNMMMLDTDMCLFWGATLQGNDMRASKISQNGRGGCCTRTIQSVVPDGVAKHNSFCGTSPNGNTGIAQAHFDCCLDNDAMPGRLPPDCDSFRNPKTGPAANDVAEFAASDSKWLAAFEAVWTKTTEQGQSGLRRCT